MRRTWIKARERGGFALVITLVIMALILVTVVGYLLMSRSGRTASDLYAGRLRSEMMADNGLTAALGLLEEQTRYGNYITAASMNAAAASGSAWLPELYRPDPAWDTNLARANYLTVSNAVGIPLISWAQPVAGTNQIDPRPDPQVALTAGNFGLTNLGLNASNAYNFNQAVRLGTNWGRLVEPSTNPVYGQWVRVRDASGALVGRYAFAAVDESMRVNLNAVGNTNGAGGTHLRYNDLTNAAAPTPNRISEIDPAPVVSTNTGNYAALRAALAAAGPAGERLPSVGTAGLLAQWSQFHDYAPMVTTLSESDNTTARGWTRMNLNAVVAEAAAAEAGGNTTAKRAAAERISNWIRDAWTGEPLASLQQHQLYNDPRLRMQVAANIVDYIDADNVPTDCGDMATANETVPVIGIERIPYLTQVDVVYSAGGTDKVNRTSTLTVSFLLKFSNLWGEDLTLQDHVGRIQLSGVPSLIEAGYDEPILDLSAEQFTVTANASSPAPSIFGVVPKGIPGNGTSGAKVFDSGVALTRAVSYQSTVNATSANQTRPIFEESKFRISVLGKNGERLDQTEIAINPRRSGYLKPSSGESLGHFIYDGNQTSAICLTYKVLPPDAPVAVGDPRQRPDQVSQRWYHTTRSDGLRRVEVGDDWEHFIRTAAVDWYDHVGDHPFCWLRNGPMQSVGELGLIAACEYAWRSLYLQHPDRPSNTTQPTLAIDIPARRQLAQDSVLLDLFTTSTESVQTGALNVNGNLEVRSGAGSAERAPLTSLFLGVAAGSESLSVGAARTLSETLVSRRFSPTTNENIPPRPFFLRGDVAAAMSRNISLSNGSTGSGSRSRINATVLSVTNNNPNLRADYNVEQPFRGVSEQITTRGNVFRVLYVGQAVHDFDGNGMVGTNEVQGEFLGEAYLRREAQFSTDPSNADLRQTTNSIYRVLSKRPVFE